MNKNMLQIVGILYRTYLSYASDFLKDTDISFSESVVLSNVGMTQGISQEEISMYLYIDRAAIARNVKTLEKKGYVLTRRNNCDKRKKELYLTDSGQKIFEYIEAHNAERLKQLFEGISKDEIRVFQDVLCKIKNNIE